MCANFLQARVKQCLLCGEKSGLISRALGVCAKCIMNKPAESMACTRRGHSRSRTPLGLPLDPPKSAAGIPCNLCANNCQIGVGAVGYCGLRRNHGGRLISQARPNVGLLHAYLDPQVTNCCSAWFCPAGTGAGFPKYANRDSPEYGYYNLAIFFYGCNFDCLFCQNSSHKGVTNAPKVSYESLVSATMANKKISCWCFFGGSPEPQLPFAIKAAREVLNALDQNRPLRICFEWNGAGHPKLVKQAAELALISGGNVKFDLKCFNADLSVALSGVPNHRTYKNFEMVYDEFYEQRAEMPMLAATTLMVPGYVDEVEVECIAKFIAALNPEIPYSLLAFHPDYLMKDLPITPLEQAVRCYRVAKKYLRKVNVGNLAMLGLRSFPQLLRRVEMD